MSEMDDLSSTVGPRTGKACRQECASRESIIALAADSKSRKGAS